MRVFLGETWERNNEGVREFSEQIWVWWGGPVTQDLGVEARRSRVQGHQEFKVTLSGISSLGPTWVDYTQHFLNATISIMNNGMKQFVGKVNPVFSLVRSLFLTTLRQVRN